MTAPSAKPLFRAINGVAAPRAVPLLGDAPLQARPRDDARRAHDFYPTGQPEAIRGLLALDGAAIRACGTVWEPACGDGALL